MTISEIIVVEDCPKHREDAQAALHDRRLHKEEHLEGILSRLQYIEGNRETLRQDGREFGVLTDLYFPAGPAQESGDYGELVPLGMLVMMRCKELGIPCVLVTAGYHHGLKYHQAEMALRLLGIKTGEVVVDHFTSEDTEAEAETKDWGKALEVLEALESKIGAG
jgi:hypothetical protein